MSNREKLFSVTAKDCVFQATKGSGPGGQHRNKTSTAIRCTHPPSGAVGFAADHKSQHRNKRVAFGRMARSQKMQDWLRLEAARRNGELAQVEENVKKQMNPRNLRVEVHDEDGLWVTMEESDGP